MAENFERKGDKAMVDEEYDLAASLYSQAIDLDPSSASLFVSRAAAHIKLENYTDAIADCNRAIEISPNLSKAHLRKGTACFNLEEYQTAKAAFEAGAAVDPNNSQFKIWIQKCDSLLREESSAVHQDVISPPEALTGKSTPMETMKEVDVDGGQSGSLESASVEMDEDAMKIATPVEPTPALPSPPKFRHEHYQTAAAVVVTVFAKNIKQEQLTVDFGEQFLSVVIDIPGDDPYYLEMRLYGKIKVTECRYSLLSTKVEIRLAKADNIQWKALEYDAQLAAAQAAIKLPEPSSKYPTSTRRRTKDWDKLEAEVKKEEKDEKLDGDAALNKLFQDIYKSADEDTRRAMNKSFVESNGTVLSTNWKEVGSKEVEKSPPKGMEVKKWQQ